MELKGFNYFSNIIGNVKETFSNISRNISNAFNGNTPSSLAEPDQLFLSDSIRNSKSISNLPFANPNNTKIDISIIGRVESLGAEKLKRVTPAELKAAGARDKTEFFKMLLPAALESERKYGVPASVTLAQAALESAWARSPIGGYNIFGIKGKGPAGTVSVSTKEYLKGKWVRINDNFAKYNNFQEAVMKHGQVFQGNYKGYKTGLDVYAKTKNDYAFIDAVGSTYATDPQYKQSIKKIMKDYDLVNMAKNHYVA